MYSIHRRQGMQNEKTQFGGRVCTLKSQKINTIIQT